MKKQLSALIPISIQKNRTFITFCLVSVLILFVVVYFAPYGARNYFNLQNELSVINNEIAELTLENKQLKNEIDRLKNDENYIQEVARKKYGMLKKDELIFDFSKKKKNE